MLGQSASKLTLRAPMGVAGSVHERDSDWRIRVCKISGQKDAQGAVVHVEGVTKLAQTNLVSLRDRDVGRLERHVLQRLQ